MRRVADPGRDLGLLHFAVFDDEDVLRLRRVLVLLVGPSSTSSRRRNALDDALDRNRQRAAATVLVMIETCDGHARTQPVVGIVDLPPSP